MCLLIFNSFNQCDPLLQLFLRGLNVAEKGLRCHDILIGAQQFVNQEEKLLEVKSEVQLLRGQQGVEGRVRGCQLRQGCLEGRKGRGGHQVLTLLKIGSNSWSDSFSPNFWGCLISNSWY